MVEHGLTLGNTIPGLLLEGDFDPDGIVTIKLARHIRMPLSFVKCVQAPSHPGSKGLSRLGFMTQLSGK